MSGTSALIETTNDVSLPYLSKMEGGYLDTVEGQEVAFSPRNAFFVSFKPTILGVSFPANRQDLGRWLRSTSSVSRSRKSRSISESAVALAHGKDHMVVGIRPRRLVHEPPGARPAASRREPRGQGRRSRRDHQGAHIDQGRDPHVEATERLNGKMRVDFGESPAPLKQVAKASDVRGASKNNGMMLDDEIKNWALRIEAKAVTLEGRLSTKGLRMLTDLIPFPAETLSLQETSQKPETTAAESAESLLDSGLEGHGVEEVLPAHQSAHRLAPYRCQGMPLRRSSRGGWSTRRRSRSIACRFSTLTRSSSPMAPA